MRHAQQIHNRRYFDDSMEIINRKGLPGTLLTRKKSQDVSLLHMSWT